MEAEHPHHPAPPLFEPLFLSTTDDEMLDSEPDQRRDEDLDIDLGDDIYTNGAAVDSDTNFAMEEDQPHNSPNDNDQLMLDEDDEVEIMYEQEPVQESAQATQQAPAILETSTVYQSTEESATQLIEEPLVSFTEPNEPENDEKLESDPITKASPAAQSPHAPEIPSEQNIITESQPINESGASENALDRQTREFSAPLGAVEEQDGDPHQGNSWSENTSTTLGNDPPFEETHNPNTNEGSKHPSEPENEYDHAETGGHQLEEEQLAPHPVIVFYDTNRVCLFPPPAQFIDDSATLIDELPSEYFIEDPEFCTKELELLFAKIRDVLQDTINPAHELVINIEELDLEFCEDGLPPKPITFSHILDLYVRLCQQDDIKHPPALQMTLGSRPSPWRQFQLLSEYAANGMGITEALEKCDISRTTNSGVAEQENGFAEHDYQHVQDAEEHKHAYADSEATGPLVSGDQTEKEKEEEGEGTFQENENSNNPVEETKVENEHADDENESEKEKGEEKEKEEEKEEEKEKEEEEEEEDEDEDEDDDFDLEYEDGNDVTEKDNDGKPDEQQTGGQSENEDNNQAGPNTQPASKQPKPPADNMATSVASEADAEVEIEEIEEIEEESELPHQLYQPDEVSDGTPVAQTAASNAEEEEVVEEEAEEDEEEELLEYEEDDIEEQASHQELKETDRFHDRVEDSVQDIHAVQQDSEQLSDQNAMPTPPIDEQDKEHSHHKSPLQSPNEYPASKIASKPEKTPERQIEPTQETELDASKPASIPVIGADDNVEEQGDYADYQEFDYDYEEEQYQDADDQAADNRFAEGDAYHGENGGTYPVHYPQESYDQNYQGEEQYHYDGEYQDYEEYPPEIQDADYALCELEYVPEHSVPEQEYHDVDGTANGPLGQFEDDEDTLVATDAVDPMHKRQQFTFEETYEYEEVVEAKNVTGEMSPGQKRQRDDVDQEEGGEVDGIQAAKRVRSI